MMKKQVRTDPDAYLDGREFLPSRMEALVKEALENGEAAEKGGGKAPVSLSSGEVDLKWELFRSESRVKKLTVCKSLLAAACLLLTIGLGMALFRPVPVEGNDTYVTLLLENGETERFVFRYKALDSVTGQPFSYKSFRELEAELGFSLVKPEGLPPEHLYLDQRPDSGLYHVSAYFEESAGAVAGYDAYFAGDREESYGYSYEISRDWERTETLSAGGREIVLYQINGLAAGQRAWGAAFSDDGVLYLFYSFGGTEKEAFTEALEGLEK
ncbi:MAG TPA: hypothetical protein H9672_06855 [Firmicutes bacterium]|nr:hypothetical protein [Bacillota bacterium]